MKDINESKDYFLLSRELSYEVERAIYKRSYYEFYKKAFKVLNPDEPFSDSWHLKYLCDRLQDELYRVARRLPREKDIIINVPFRSSKSLIVSVIFPVWAWTIKASTKFICVSFSSDLSLELATLSRNLIESEWIKDLYGSSMELIRDENTKGFFKNKGGGFRKSVGTGGQITGSGADFILCLPEGQIITTSEGPKDIKDIVENKLDVQILSYNHKSNEVEYKNIVRYDKNQGRKLIKITLESGKEIICTEDHEIWTEEDGYIKAKELTLIDTLLSNKESIEKEKISKIEYIEEIPEFVYNIEVEGNHNYFANNILTHNCDDAQNPKKAASETERKNTIEFYTRTLYSRLNQPEIGVRVNIQQRLHEQDLTGYLMKNHEEEHELIKIPAEITLEDQPVPSELSSFYKDNLFWPSRFSQSQLATYRKILGSYGAAGQLQQRPAPAEGGLVKREWFVELDPITLQRDITDHPINFYLDTADTKDENQQDNDYTAILTAYRKDNYVFIVDVVQVKKQFFELCKFIPEYTTKHYYTNNSKIKVEPKSSGRSIVSQLKSTTMLNIVELSPPKDDKMTRLMAIQPLLESGRVKLIKGNYTKDFLDQLCMFPNAQNDDMVDTLIYAVMDLLMESDFDFMFT